MTIRSVWQSKWECKITKKLRVVVECVIFRQQKNKREDHTILLWPMRYRVKLKKEKR